MRNILLPLCFTTSLLSVHVQAQKLFDLGIKGGVNMDDLSTSYTHTGLVGGNVGLFARVKPIILPGVQGEVLLSSMGSSVSILGQHADLRTITLQIPLFLVLSLGPLELHAGGYYDRQLAKNWDITDQLVVEGTSITIDDVRDGTFGLLFGAGARLSHFYFGARYNYGLQSIGTGAYLGDVKNRQAQMYIGWGFF